MKAKQLLLCGITAAIVLSGCGSSSSTASYNKGDYAAATESYDDYAYYDDYSYSEEYAAEADYDAGATNDSIAVHESGAEQVNTTENASTTNRKLIKNVSLNVETKEFDSLTANIQASIVDAGGYIESMDLYNGSQYSNYTEKKYANIVARIPAKKLDGFVNTIGEKSNVTNHTESVDDVTLTYVDMTSRRDVLEAELQRLLEYLESAANVEEIIALEDRISTVRYQLESMESQIRTYDNQVDYSTVRINISEVATYTPTPKVELSAGERIKEGFAKSLKDVGYSIQEFFINFVIDLPYIIMGLIKLAINVGILFLIYKLIIRFIDKKYMKEQASLGKQMTLKEAHKARKAAKKAERAQKKAMANAPRPPYPVNMAPQVPNNMNGNPVANPNPAAANTNKTEANTAVKEADSKDTTENGKDKSKK